MHGLGNDFVVINGVSQHLRVDEKLLQHLGNRHTGVGCDQILIVEPPKNPEADFFQGAVHTLFHTTWIEVVLLSTWIGWREPGEFRAVRTLWPRMLLIGSAGFTASLCWFWSFSLTIVAYAKAVGQIEALLAVVLGIKLMGERELVRQLPGLALTMLGIVLVLLG